MAKYKLKKKFKLLLFFIILIIFVISFINITSLNKKDNTIKDNNNKTTTTTTEKIKEVKLTLVGDLLFEQPFYDAISAGDNPDIYLKRINDKYFLNDDITIGNMEVPINAPGVGALGTGYNFNAPLWVGELVAKQSFELLGTANNHTYDQRLGGLESTLNFFKDNSNIMTVGSYLSDEDRNTPRIIEKNGIKIGFLAYTMGTNISIPSEYFNRVAHFRNPYTAEVEDSNLELLKNEITNIKNQVDVMIVLMHWGHEFTYTPTEQQRYMANYLNSLGVDIIVGSHSHCMQPIEWIENENKTLVYYSLGNFLSADYELDGTSRQFDNAYQIGLISTLKITKNDDNIIIDNINTEPIINYYDSYERNYELIPLNDYTDDYEINHARYEKDLTKEWIIRDFYEVINEEFR